MLSPVRWLGSIPENKFPSGVESGDDDSQARSQQGVFLFVFLFQTDNVASEGMYCWYRCIEVRDHTKVWSKA